MADKNINVILLNRHDTDDNWATSKYQPRNGEIIVYDNSGRLKVGNGSATPDQLPFLDKNYYLTLNGNRLIFSNDGVGAVATDITLPDNDTLYYAKENGGLVLDSDTKEFSLDNSGVIAGTYETDSTKRTPQSGGIFTVPRFVVDSHGRITEAGTVDITLPIDNDSKASSGSTTQKIYLIGTVQQSESGQITYSYENAYVQDGYVYSGCKKVLTEETELSKSTTTITDDIGHGDQFTVVESISVDNHKITETKKIYTIKPETNLSKGNTTEENGSTLSFGGDLSVLDNTTVSGHVITDNKKKYTLPSETAISTSDTTGTAKTPSHGDSITVVTNVLKGNSSHSLSVEKTNITLPTAPGVAVSDGTAGTQTPKHGDTFTAISDITADGHGIKKNITTYTLPTETTVSINTDKAGTAITLEHGNTFEAITGLEASGHTITPIVTTFTLPSKIDDGELS